MATTFSDRRFLKKTGVAAASVSVVEDFRDDEDSISASLQLHIPTPFDGEKPVTYGVRISTPWKLQDDCPDPYTKKEVIQDLEEMTEEVNQYTANLRAIADMLDNLASAVDTSAARFFSKTIDRMAQKDKAIEHQKDEMKPSV